MKTDLENDPQQDDSTRYRKTSTEEKMAKKSNGKDCGKR
jgi:hypothetical protein